MTISYSDLIRISHALKTALKDYWKPGIDNHGQLIEAVGRVTEDLDRLIDEQIKAAREATPTAITQV